MRSFKNRQIQRDEVKTPDLSAFRCQIGDDNSLALEKRVRKFLKVGVFGLALITLITLLFQCSQRARSLGVEKALLSQQITLARKTIHPGPIEFADYH